MRHVRLVVVVAALTLWPGVAHASWWSWLEELSGPGPFTGTFPTFSVPLACFADGKRVPCWNPQPVKQTIAVAVSRFNSDGRRRFKDLPADDPGNTDDVNVVPLSGLYLFRPHRAVDVGPGIGVMFFSGSGFDTFARFVVTPINASIRPLVFFNKLRGYAWARVIRLEVDSSFVTKGFKGTDFGNTRTKFESGPEFLTRTGLVIDFGGLVR
jgi:hypothetical protein